MSVEAEWQGGADQVASNAGWSGFGRWAESLDHGRYPAVVQLWEHGGTDSAAALATQLAAALTADPPDDVTVRTTAAGLLRLARRAGTGFLAVG